MNDLERRLRAALSAATEQAPPGLMDAILRRRRRHRRRVGASVIAAAAVVVLAAPPLLTSALHDWNHAGAATAPTRSAPRDRDVNKAPAAAPGTVLAGCANADVGSVGDSWRQSPATHAGPLWFLGGGHSSRPVGWHGRVPLYLYVAVVVLTDQVKPGSVVVAKAAPAGRPYLRFLYGPHDSFAAGTKYTMRSGEAGVSFESCPPMPPGITDYYGVFLVLGARCVPVQVWLPGSKAPISIRLGACPGH